ncbi:MAG: hypothetical protein H6702_08580 [Myxococcales bacterium]|nr:hypothetical protein [Myxococcales bacterium]
MAGPYVADGQTVPQWIAAMQADDPAWGTVGPSPLPACGTLAACDQCAVCAAQRDCAAEYGACERQGGGCVEAAVCGLRCARDDNACLGACVAAFPQAGAPAVALYQCAIATCPACP